jgi:hypothetical protein
MAESRRVTLRSDRATLVCDVIAVVPDRNSVRIGRRLAL